MLTRQQEYMKKHYAMEKTAAQLYWFELTWLAITIIQTKNTVPMIQNANSACQH
jgi:hypothetical protein